MNDVDKRAIELLAVAPNYYGPERGAAEDAYMRSLKTEGVTNSLHQRFASEVFAVCPDLMLRGSYRRQLRDIYGYTPPTTDSGER